MEPSINIPIQFITNNGEKRLTDNRFSLELKGYHLFPVDSKIPIYKKADLAAFGTCEISSIHWEAGKTYITYNLLSLHFVH